MLTLLTLGCCLYLKQGMPSRVPAKANIFCSYRKNYAFREEITAQQAAAGQFVELGAQGTNQPIEILIWGDSHAMSVTPVLDELCRRFSVRGIEATHSATAPILGYFKHDPFSLEENSLAFSRSVVEFIAKNHIKAVIIAAAWFSYGPPDLVNDKLAATVQTIMASGASVYVLKDVPRPDFDVPRFAALTVMHHGDLLQLGTLPEKYAAANHDYDSIFNRLSKLGATVLDTPKCFLNTNGLYDVVRDDKVLYFDDNHLSVQGSRLLLPLFEPLFKTL
jgi:hypothetical protein